jgi:enamine deaminase RidA (YjgF/YER057c/UK114 family)
LNYREIVIPGADGARVSAVQIGPLVYAPRLLPLTSPSAGLEAQLESVLERVRSVADEPGCAEGEETGGLANGDLARVTLFMREVRDRRVLNDVWRRWFPDPARRPPHKYVPADVPGGYAVMADAVAVRGGGRRILQVPGLEHRDPMSMGARLGNLVFSSRLFTAEESVESQLTRLLGHAGTLMREAGGSTRDLTQVTLFVSSAGAAAAADTAWQALWAATGQTPPDLHVAIADLGGNGNPRMEVIGVIRHV